MVEKFPIDEKRWREGLSLAEFVAGMRSNQQAMRRRLAEVPLTDEERRFFVGLDRSINVLVMTEDWCGDGVMNLPILARICEAAPKMEMRIFVRSQWPDLNEYYQSRDIYAIPVFTFLDTDFREIGTWVEKPQPAHLRVGQWKAAHPEIKAVQESNEFSIEEKRARLKKSFAGLMEDMERWYERDLQRATVEEIKALLMGEVIAGG